MRKKLSEDYNLAICFPEIAKEWHPTKNGNVLPSDVLPGSGKKYWWICKKKHIRLASPSSRKGTKKRKGSSCPKCKD